ncbi:hypothetical protein ABID29_002153 [Streptococcus rupicaprae]|uniref:Zinc ribbon domain-containing protein n=1 Tax=Streptococcus rupicaprae TaxID=759619 RepID=A0ABV2FK90_9STRE
MKKQVSNPNRKSEVSFFKRYQIFSAHFVIFLFFLAFFIMGMFDTIRAGGDYVDYGRKAGSNYEAILLGVFGMWVVCLGSYDVLKLVRQEERLEKKLEQDWQLLSPKEKAIQANMDLVLENIAFLGIVLEKPTKGRFCCRNCGYEWEASITKIYNRKQCGQCAIHYAKQEKRD